MYKARHQSKPGVTHTARHALRLLLGLAVLAGTALPDTSYAKRQQAATVSAADKHQLEHYSVSLEDLGVSQPIDMRSADGQRGMDFSLRNDEVITAATLRLVYSWSPSLIPELSHIKVFLNNELMKTLPLTRENSDGRATDIPLDPALLVNFNHLRFQLIAHYTRDCEDPMHSSLWANISNQSRINFTVRHLQLHNDLSLLPAPFFDKLDRRELKLPFVFKGQPDNKQLHAAGVVASWFGSKAGYRGAQFPIQIDSYPQGNAVLFVIGTAAPEKLSLPPIDGASLAIVNNPDNPYAKLLVVMGRNAEELDLAAQALTLGNPSLSGSIVGISKLDNLPLRKPYDAPNWIPTDRPVHLGELAKLPQLQAAGMTPDAIRVNFNLPPDIFTWRSDGVPLELHYRYTQRPKADKSSLNVDVNDSFVRSLPLASTKGSLSKMANTILEPDNKAVSSEHIDIPTEKIYGQNQLQLRYFFDYTKEGSCKDVYLYNERGAIDPDSSIDFSSFPHYTALPNLSFFVNDGFPYTRMADLSETAVVMPNNASLPEMETYLQIMGRMGKVTGYPAVHHLLLSASKAEANPDKDLILIGTSSDQPLLGQWADHMHPLLENGTHKLRLPGPFERLKSRWDNRDLEDAMHRAGDLITKGEGGLGAMVAFESPLKAGRSVVAFTGDDAGQILALANAASDPKIMENFHGDLVLHSGKRAEGFQLGPTYYTGHLPWWTSLRWHLSRQPLLLAILIGLAALLVAIIAFRGLRKLAARRMEKHDSSHINS